MMKSMLVIAVGAALVASPAAGHVVQVSKSFAGAQPYGPYEFLIGDWYSDLPQENAVIHQQFGWGPGKASLTYGTYIDLAGKAEHLHFGGFIIWNGKAQNLDYLFAVEPGSGVEAKGTFSRAPDRSVVREVEETYPGGRIVRSRQTFRQSADGTLVTDLLSETPKGWVSSLPGGPMVMSRTPPR